MALKDLASFGAGEITPELFERGNLDKFRTGLKTLRNITPTKTGGLRCRSGTVKITVPTVNNNKSKFIWIDFAEKLYQFIPGSVIIHSNYDPETFTFANSTTVNLSVHDIADDIDTLQLTNDEKYVYLYKPGGFFPVRIEIATNIALQIIWTPQQLIPLLMQAGFTFGPFPDPGSPPAGPFVQYKATIVLGGIEIDFGYQSAAATLREPVPSTTQYNVLNLSLAQASIPSDFPVPEEVRWYKRPDNGGAYGFIGIASPLDLGTNYIYQLVDAGIEPDFANIPPIYQADFSKDASVDVGGVIDYRAKPEAFAIFQDRIIFSGTRTKSLIFGTRPNSSVMTRDFPLQSDSAVAFAIGSDGAALPRHMIDHRGLMIFTNKGIYETIEDILTPNNAFAIKRSSYVADTLVRPFSLGSYAILFDNRQKAVIGLVPADSTSDYTPDELSIYSKHLFKKKRIVSWAVQEKETNIVWMVLDDGNVLSFSFQEEQQLRAWARHDFKDGIAEEVVVMNLPDGSSEAVFHVRRGAIRTIEQISDRDAEFMEYVGSDSSIVYKDNLALAGDLFEVKPVVADDWEGVLDIRTGFTIPFSNAPLFGEVGTIFRFFRPDGFPIDFTVTEYVDTDHVRATCEVDLSEKFPEGLVEDMAGDYVVLNSLYVTRNTFTGLAHLEGKKVSVRLDGFTHASPLNTQAGYEEYTVTGGQISLNPPERRGAIVSIGLPMVQDIETLPVDTVEQAPTKTESQIVNKMFLSYFESLEVYAGATLPKDDTITGMDIQEYEPNSDEGNVAMVARQPFTERREIQTSGRWQTKGTMALRNVDPQPFALIGIILDTEVRRR